MNTRIFRAVTAAVLLAAGTLAVALPSGSALANTGQPTIVISRDNGGSVVEYARAVTRARNDNTFVRFQGQCASACTLFLSLNPSRTCITRNVSFLFHLPYGADDEVNQWSAQYMEERYPAWVRQWISANGGLSDRLIRMEYSYASQFMQPCAET